MHIREAENRAVKVEGLIGALERFSAYRGRPVLASELLTWNETSWLLAACMAGITPPSVETRSLVIRRLADRDAAVLSANEAARGRVVQP